MKSARKKDNRVEWLSHMDMKTKLSTLWIFVLFNVVFRDIHELFRPGFLAEVMTGVVNGNQSTDIVLLLGGIMVEVLILMVILSRFLPYGLNRWTNIVVSVLTAVLVITTGPKDLDDLFFATIEIIALGAVIWLAWRWPKPIAAPVQAYRVSPADAD